MTAVARTLESTHTQIMDPIHQRIEDAKRVLYNLDPVDGSIISKSKLYEMYEKNAAAYAKAQSDYAAAYAKAQSNPMALQTWPLTGKTYRQAIDNAWDSWMSGGKDKIERALGIIEPQSKTSQ